jgi:hypothetical protein
MNALFPLMISGVQVTLLELSQLNSHYMEKSGVFSARIRGESSANRYSFAP